MRSATFALLLLPLLLAMPPAAADSTAYAPSFVTVTLVSELTTAVSWAPGSEVADAYNVYGLAAGADPVLLGTFVVTSLDSAASSLAVPSGFDGYGVSGVQAQVESPMIAAAVTTQDPCVVIGDDWVVVDLRCLPVVVE